MKKKQKNIFIGVGVVFAIILLLGVLMYQPTSQNVSYYNDDELGLIKIKISEESLLSKLFGSQQAFFSTTTTTLGKSVTVSDYLPVGFSDTYSKANIQYANLYISIDGNSDLYKSILANIPAGVINPRIDVTYTPPRVGKYTAYTVIMFKNGESVETSRANDLRVTTPENECTKKPYFSSWTTKNTVSNGIIQERNFYSITSSCTEKLSSTEDRISCNNGYVVSGTSSTIATYTGVQKCEAVQKPVEPECNTDLKDKCSDGTEVVIKVCSNGFYAKTGNSCSVIDIPYDFTCGDGKCDVGEAQWGCPADCGEYVGGCATVSPGNQKQCCINSYGEGYYWNGKECTDVMIDPEEQSFLEKYEPYFMYIGAGIVVLLILLIGYNFIKRR